VYFNKLFGNKFYCPTLYNNLKMAKKKKRPLRDTGSDHEFDQRTKYSQKASPTKIVPSELGWIETRKEIPTVRQQFQFVSNGVTIQFPFTVLS
jgi:hypothetical protein